MSNPATPCVSGHLFVISAPSGAGKTSLVRALVARTADLVVSVSHTTRAQRGGEIAGQAYHFVDETTFRAMIEADEFLEHATVFDRRYGTARAVVAEQLAQGRDVILEIDWQGARSIRAAVTDTISIFVLPPSVTELERRLRGRGDDHDNVARRMRDAVSEMSHHGEYDYLVINDDFDRALDDLAAIIRTARLRHPVQAARHADLLQELVAT